MGTNRKRNFLHPILLVSLLVVAGVAADKCKSGCRGSQSSLLKYEQGQTYKYNFNGVVSVLLAGSESQETSLTISSDVLITQLAACNQLLRLENVQITGRDAKKYGTLDDINKPVRFNFNDGLVDAEICTEPGDSQNSLNVKRAIISLLQSAAQQKSETDVFGTCPTTFITKREKNILNIIKKRNLNQCEHREGLSRGFFTSHRNLLAEIKSSPLLSGDYTCEQRIKDNIIDHVLLTEEYHYKPFSTDQTGARAKSVSRLTFKGKSGGGAQAGRATNPRSIIFENPHVQNSRGSNLQKILSILKSTVVSVESSVRPNSARQFTNLIKIIRVSSKNDLLTAYSQASSGAGYSDKTRPKKVYFDALVRAGTGDSVEALVELINQFDNLQKKLVYISLAHTRHVTPESLTSVAKLVNKDDAPRELLLSAGIVASHYCREHSCEGEVLRSISDSLIRKIGNCAPRTRKAEDVVIAALKGLRNIGHLNGAAVNKISSCIHSQNAPTRVRVAAISSIQASPCEPKLVSVATEVLQNRQLDSELRIEAYLSLVQCPSGALANNLKQVLETETVNQVGSFITSHLRNLRASTSPEKESARQHLSLVRSNKKFPVDIRKYSFNNEISYAIESLGLGATAESNVIYSQKSFLPRSASLNLDTEVFGNQINLLEVTARQENLDRLLEHYLGPKGILRNISPYDAFVKTNSTIEGLLEKARSRFESSIRQKRATKQEIDEFSKKKIAVESDLDFDLGVKMFGSEFLFLSLGDEAIASPSGILDKAFDLLDEGLHKAKRFNYEINQNVLFLDAELAYPTGTGLALKFVGTGTASVELGAAGKIDIPQMIRDPANAKLELKLIPSANVEIVGELIVDAQIVSTGLQLVANLHTSTGSDVTVGILNGKGIDVKIGLPLDKQEIFTVGHEILFTTQERGNLPVLKELQFKSEEKNLHGCFDQLKSYIGLTFCGDIRFAIPKIDAPFPLNGPSKISLRIEKENLKEYHLRALYTDEGPAKRSVLLLFDAPGGQRSREITVNVGFGDTPALKYVQLELKAPDQSAGVKAEFINNNKELSASASVQLDNNEIYKAKVGVLISGSQNRQVYRPVIEYKTPEGPGESLVSVTGEVVVENRQDVYLYNFNNIQVLIKDHPTAALSGTVSRNREEIITNLKISQADVSITISGKLTSKDRLMKIVEAKIINSVQPTANIRLNAYLDHSNSDFGKLEIDLVHGEDLDSKVNRLYIYRETNLLGTVKDGAPLDKYIKNTVTYPALAILFRLDGRITERSAAYELKAEYDDVKIGSKLDAKVGPKSTYDIDLEAKFNDYKFEFEGKRQLVDQDKSKLTHSLEVVAGQKYEVSSTILIKALPGNLDTTSEFEVKLPSKNYKANLNIAANDKVINSAGRIISGKDKVVDFDLKISRGASGTLKVSIKDLVNVNGGYTVKNGKGSGSFDAVIIELDRKIKGTVDFAVTSPNINVDINLFYNADKDNSKKVHLSTKNHVTDNHIDSKNVLELNTYRTEFNLNGNREGQLNNGKLTGKFDLELPNGNYIEGSLKRDQRNNGDIINNNCETQLSFAQNKKSQPSKLKIVGKVSNLNKKLLTFDSVVDVTLTKSDGKTIIIKETLKHFGDGEKRTIENQVDASGTLLPQSLGYSVKLQLGKIFFDYDIDAYKGSDSKLKLNGKVVYDANEKANNLHLLLNLPYEQIRSLEFNTESYLKHSDEAFQFNIKNVAKLNNNPVVLDLKLGGKKLEGLSGDLKYQLKNENPFLVGFSYVQLSTKDETKAQGSVKATYGDKKQVTLSGTVTVSAGSALALELNLRTPYEQASNIDLNLTHKKTNDGNSIHTDLVVSANTQKYSLTSALEVSETTPSFDVRVTLPNNKIYHVAAKVQKLSERKWKSSAQIESAQFNFDGTFDANLEDVDNLSIHVELDSAVLKLNKVVVNVLSKTTKSGKKIEFSAKSANKNLVSGSTTYQIREEGSKLIVEGQGQVLVKDEKRNANFKFIRNNLQESDERGILVDLTANLGSQQFVGETKLTNKRFQIKNSYCEEKKQCAHIELSSELKHADLTELDHVLEISVDLRKLGLTHEFGLKASTKRQGINLDHTVDVHFHSQDKPKYQYSLYFKPKEAGVILTLPQRTVSIEGTLEVPKTADGLGPLTAKLEVYLNKVKQPSQKASLFFESNVVKSDRAINLKFKTGFHHPSIKELAISGNLNVDAEVRQGQFKVEVDIFRQKNQQIAINGKFDTSNRNNGKNITSEISIISQGLGIDILGVEHFAITEGSISLGSRWTCRRERQNNVAEVLFSANAQQIELLVRSPFVDIIHLDTKYTIAKERLFADSSIALLGSEEVVVQSSINDFRTLVVETYRKSNPSNRLSIYGEVLIDKLAKLEANILRGQEKKNLVNIKLHLDSANFLKTDFVTSSENIKALLENVRQRATENFERLKAVSTKASEDTQNRIQKYPEQIERGLPDFKPLVESYKKQLEDLKQELLTDKTIKELADFLEKVFGVAIQTLHEIFVTVSQSLEKVTNEIQEFFAKIRQTYVEQIQPQLVESYKELVNVYTQIASAIVNEVTGLLERIAEYLKAHEADFQKITNAISKSLQGILSGVGQVLAKVKDELTELVTLAVEQLKNLPAVAMLKEQYNELFSNVDIPEQVFGFLSDILAAVMDIMPTAELRDFVASSYDYVTKILKKEKVDDVAEIRKLYDLFIKAVKSVIALVQSHASAEGISIDSIPASLPFSLDGFKKLPSLITVKLSPLNLLRVSEWPSLQNILAYRPTSLNPLSILPPFLMTGYIADGQHIFTFDGRHLTFPGSCDYVLAQDYVDGNFTIVASLDEGKLKAITVSDKENLVRIGDDGTVKLNGKPSDFPVQTSNLFAWREYHSYGIATSYGAKLKCSLDLRLCYFEVNGYYLGKLRGLLGDGNGEPFDDFRVPEGEITTSESDFGNSYKLKGNCPNKETIDHSHHHGKHSPLCSDIFAGASTLRPCFFIVDPAPYRQACEHAVATSKDKHDAACNIGQIYTVTCWKNLVHVPAPSQCGKCEVGQGKKAVTVGDVFSTKAPVKQADIVFVVGTDSENENVVKHLVYPLINQLAAELKKPIADVPDVQIAVIGYNKQSQYPHIYTTNGKINFRGKDGIKIAKSKEDEYPEEFQQTSAFKLLNVVEETIDEIKYELGLDSATRAYNLAIEYPFRPSAAKIVIGVHSEKFADRHLPLQDLKILVANKVYQFKGITFNLITDLPSLSLSGSDKSGQVVGFNSNTVFLLSDARRKPDGNPELRSKLTHEHDAAVEFAETVNGNIYSSHNFIKSTPQQRNKFLTVLTGSLVEQISRTETTQECACVYSTGLFPEAQCFAHDKKLLPKRGKGQRG